MYTLPVQGWYIYPQAVSYMHFDNDTALMGFKRSSLDLNKMITTCGCQYYSCKDVGNFSTLLLHMHEYLINPQAPLPPHCWNSFPAPPHNWRIWCRKILIIITINDRTVSGSWSCGRWAHVMCGVILNRIYWKTIEFSWLFTIQWQQATSHS